MMTKKRSRPIGLVRGGVGLTVLAAVAVGCSNGPDFETFPAETSTPVVSTSLAEPSTTVATEVADTPAPPQPTAAVAPTTPPTTEAPVATTTLEQSITEGLAAARAALLECSVSPATCNAEMYAVAGSPEYQRVVKLISERAEVGLVVRVLPETNLELVESIALEPGQQAAKVVVCRVNGNWLMQNAGTPDDVSDDILVDDSTQSIRLELRIVITLEGWRVTDSVVIDPYSEGNQCVG